MAIAIRAPSRHVAHRPPWVRQRANDDGARVALLLMVPLSLFFAIFILSGQTLQFSIPRTLLPSLQPTATTRPTDGAIPAAKLKAVAEPEQSTASLQQQSVTGSAPDAAPLAERGLAAGARARVANTDGMGVVFYSAPRTNARIPAGLLEGTSVTVLETADGEWARVQSDSKKTGWVRSSYLVPAD